MASHVIDWLMVQNSFGTDEMREIWSDENRLQKHLDVESALAEVESEIGLIPKDAAYEITQNAKATLYDIQKLSKEVAIVKHSLMPTIHALEKKSGKYGEYVHFGVTTQDVVDTGVILQLKESHNIIMRELKEVAFELYQLTKKHKDTPMVGRSHGMQALPTTFGFKMAIILDEIIRHLERLKELENRVFVGVIAGAIGTYASFGEKGAVIEEKTLERLHLNTANICWHASRDRISEYANVIALISGTLGKLGNEFYNLMRTEINEIEEPFSKGNIGSSTMPHKRNPAIFEGMASLTKPILHCVALINESLVVEHERDAMSWRAEWIALPEICIYISSQLKNTKYILNGLVVKKENMLKNLDILGGLLLSERVMFALSEKIGKQTAHHLIYELSMRASEENVSFKILLFENEQVNQILSKEQIEALLDVKTYTGLTGEKVEQVLAYAKQSGFLDDYKL